MNIPNTQDRSVLQRQNGLFNALRRTSISTLLTVGIVGTAFAQNAPAPAPTDNTYVLPEVSVTGYQQSLEKALSEKRSSLENIDVITAQDVGKFPDTNLAESLSHIPGVTVDRLFGEGERVSILGTDPNLNRVLLNGEPISTADWYVLDNASRQFDYLLIAPDAIGQAAVYRTWEPKLLEGSIGGTVIVDTRNPLELKPFEASANISDVYNDRSKNNKYSASAMVSWHNATKTIGFLVGAEDQHDFLRRDGVEALSLQNQNNFSVSGPPGGGAYGNWLTYGQPAGSWYTDEVVNTALFEQDRHRQGFNAALVVKPTDRLTVDLTALYVKQTMNNSNFSYYIYPGDDWSGQPYLSNATVSGGILNSYTINSAPLVIDSFNRAAQIITQDYDGVVTYKGDNFNATVNSGYTRATGGTQHQFFAEYFLFATANVNESASQASFNITSVTAEGAGAGDSNASNLASGADFNQTGQPGFDYGNIASNPEVDDEKWLQVDVDVPLKGGALKSFDFGGRFSDHNNSQNGNVVSIPGLYENGAGTANAPTLSAIGVVNAPSNFLSGISGITPTMTHHIVQAGYGPVANFVGNLSSPVAGETLLQYFNSQPPGTTAVFTAAPTFMIDERINAAYFEGTFSDGPLAGNFGARWVETQTTSTSYDISAPGGPALQTVNATYDNFLPAANLVYDLTPDQDVRFGLSQVIARPNTSAEANYVQLYDSSLSGVGGNADLRPYESVNVDLDYEWFFAKNSYVAVDLFYKDISNYILIQSNPETHADYFLNANGSVNATYQIARPTNGGPATSEGAALSYQQEFGGGFGVQANYTRIHTTSALGPLPFTSDNQINISPYFENRWGLFRITYAWRDQYKSTSFNATQAIWTVPYTEVDANASINITKNFSILLTGTNLLDETYRQYFKIPSGAGVFADAYKFGRTYSIGLHVKF